MNKPPIYLDNHATTRVDPRVVEAMLPFFTERYGNPSSAAHAWGWEAEEAVENARAQVAAAIAASPKEAVFTSGATEACNLALKGVLAKYRKKKGRHLVTTAIEHPAVLEVARHLERTGAAEVSYVGVDRSGVVDPAAVERALRDDTALVSVIAASNEIGTIQPLAEIARVTHANGALLHTDAAQALGKIPFDVGALGVDLASLSAHKVYGPKGVGALFVRRRVRVAAEMLGGGQERGRRSGTLPVPNVVGFGVACAIAAAEREVEAERLRALRDHLHRRLTTELADVVVNGESERRLPGNLNLSFTGVEGESLLMSLKRVALSSGSACSSEATEPSHVLSAIGLSPELAHAALRFGIGRFNTEAEIDATADELVEVVGRLRAMSPVYDRAAS